MTIKDIARECGCGLGTVSRVLNNHPDVSDQMRERVLAVVHKYGFVSNQSAKLLRSQDNKTIAILMKGTSSILLNSLVERIQKRMERLPYTTNVVVLDEYDNEAKQAYQVCQRHRPLGLIFAGGNPDFYKEDFANIRTPCVIITNQANDVQSSSLSSVSTDDIAAAQCMAEHLVANGHRNIGIIGGDLASSELSQRRYKGFLSVLQKHGIPFDPERQYAVSKYSLGDGANAAQQLAYANPDMSAIFTMSDVMAIGAIRRLTDLGRSVPGDISVTGFDGLDIANFLCPRLTTIRQLLDELAERGLDALLDNIERGKPCSHQLVPFEFVAGESVCKRS